MIFLGKCLKLMTLANDSGRSVTALHGAFPFSLSCAEYPSHFGYHAIFSVH